MAAQLMSQLTGDLKLSAEQLAKLKGAFQQFREKRKAAKEAGGDMKAKIKEIKQELKSGIQGMLTEEQRQKFTETLISIKTFFKSSLEFA